MKERVDISGAKSSENLLDGDEFSRAGSLSSSNSSARQAEWPTRQGVCDYSPNNYEKPVLCIRYELRTIYLGQFDQETRH